MISHGVEKNTCKVYVTMDLYLDCQKNSDTTTDPELENYKPNKLGRRLQQALNYGVSRQ